MKSSTAEHVEKTHTDEALLQMKPGDFMKRNKARGLANLWSLPYEDDEATSSAIREIEACETFLIVAISDKSLDAYVLTSKGELGYVGKGHLKPL